MEASKSSTSGNKSSKKEDKKVVLPKTLADIQRFKLEKLLKNPDKPVFIPEKRDPKLPRVFNPPEFVRNIWGSSAGAGSGDFHVYRGVRRREYARQKFLDEKSKKDELDEKFHESLTKHKQEAVERTNKKRAKRLKKKQKAKEAKKSKVAKSDTVKNSADGSDSSSGGDDDNSSEEDGDTERGDTQKIDNAKAHDNTNTSDGDDRHVSGPESNSPDNDKSDSSSSFS